ncbi:MAG: hypothetical protein DMG10_12040 [Acidobacteria bacterium]|nr:MAG: hypothetical protein DMG10_12040 [Acidobacteriota bacterium]PYV39280.1 MAG: hypothetical protein DMG09_09580 [Acidobacteriota bacterium]
MGPGGEEVFPGNARFQPAQHLLRPARRMQDACAPRKPSLPMRRGRTQETAAEVKLCFSALEEREELSQG